MLSWYAHNMLPDIVKRYSVAYTLLIEILVPFLFYSPFREHRIFATLSNIALMVAVALTGNYNFFNFLTTILLMLVLDDQFIFKYLPMKLLQFLDIKVPLECIVSEMKSQDEIEGRSWCGWRLLGKLRTLISYATLVSSHYYSIAFRDSFYMSCTPS